ncbi:MAG TPA: hypothetical protein VK892_20065 [Pyrinomonadaceae bacterium]|nr:hypothetical protein [Pyrinomonadaceae bacterium]
MKITKKICIRLCFSAVSIFLLFQFSFAQQTKPPLKRTTYKTEKVEFGVGGTVSIVGAPEGSITIEGWQNNEVEISAEITTHAATEADLALLAQVNDVVVEAGFGRISILTAGVHDKRYIKRVAKKFPKHLENTPFRIDYHIKVPIFTDLEITGGKGDFNLSGVEGAMRINFLESNAKMNLIGGLVNAVFGSGTVETIIATRSWRGRHADIQLASGEMTVYLPLNLSAQIDASVLRTGKIENAYEFLKPRDRSKFTEKAMLAKAGNGGATLSFTVGDGTLNLLEIKK